MRSDDLEDALIKKLSEHFKEAAKDYVVKDSTETPFLQLTIEMTLFNYFVVRVMVEKNTVFFSIVQSGVQLPLFKSELSDSGLDAAPSVLDSEIRLRIPDKYLRAKGW